MDDILYSIDDFPMNNSIDQIYSFSFENEKNSLINMKIRIFQMLFWYDGIKERLYNFYNNIIANYINNDGITRRTALYWSRL